MPLDNILQVTASVSIALISVAFGLQKLLKSWKATEAESNIISLMYEGMERLTDQNKALSNEVMELRETNKRLSEKDSK